MRSLKLSSAVTAAAALLALAPAGAVARNHTHTHAKHRTSGASCGLTLNVAPRLVTAGETALAFGQLSCAPATEGGQTVILYEHAAGTPNFTVAGTATTDAHGSYQITTPALTANSDFYAVAAGAQSRHRNVRVAAQVTLSGPAEAHQLFIGHLKTGRVNAVTFTGTVSPNDAGARVVLQRQSDVRGNGWHRIGLTVVTSNGTFAITHIFRVPGDSNIRVLVRENHHNVASPSNVLTYEISQAQNPALTIQTSSNPIPFGGSVTITGSVPGAPNTAVTLLARGAGAKFAPVVTGKTDGSGNYSFPPQSPPVSTFYKVQGAGKSSAVLYQGVKYLLTAAVSATSVQSGQPLTFTGTATPARPGHVIYLERQNLLGTGFHVVAVGTESAGGAYAITHAIFPPGNDVFRIKIPGDPGNGGTASQLFTINVTPRPSGSKLTPESPGNSGLPSQGQV